MKEEVMQASIRWLKEYVDFNQSAKELAEILTTAGIMVTQIIDLGKGLENVDDTVLEFALKANRADCFSMIGLAREIAAFTGGTLKKPMLTLKETAEDRAANLLKVSLEETQLCPRYAARVLRNVKVAQSPRWLREKLLTIGMQPLNNVKDVLHFVMLEMGQPLHAYDYNLLSRHHIIVRKANLGEKITTIDGVKRELVPEMLVIADEVQAVGIAGVMGGITTEVTPATQNVLLEAAAFNAAGVRRTSRTMGLCSEASSRFARGVDTANVIRALDRAAQLLEDMGACKVCRGIVDIYPEISLPVQVSFHPQRVNDDLGTDLSKNKMLEILRKLGFEIDSSSTDTNVVVNVPTWRGDVRVQADICVEIARFCGNAQTI
jgi:phenylalanyl-tRNA synthetase beta chain